MSDVLKLCTLANLKLLNLDLNCKVKQIGEEIKNSSDLLENVCTSQFEGTFNMKWFWANSLPSHPPVPWNHQKIIGFQRKQSFFSQLSSQNAPF